MMAASDPRTDGLRIEVFGFDVAEISQIRRIRALIGLGHNVHSFTMRRDNMNKDFEPDWPNTHLFMTENENLPKRAAIVAASVVKMAKHRARLRAADMIIARNLDMVAIAWAARAMAGAGHVPLVYECLDINGALCGDGPKSHAMRAAERRLLAGVQMLVVSSPGFIRNYFKPLQDYDGPWALWENKLAAGTALPDRPKIRTASDVEAPLRLGWVGTIRCAPSLALLAAVADQLGNAVEVHIHGIVHRHALPDFDATLAAHPNMILHGPYEYPGDLAQIYGGLDLVWAQDLWQTGNNSDWLLPNRIYEASWAGCPSLAVSTTETGRRVAEDHLGWVTDSATPDALIALLASLDRTKIAERSHALLNRPASDFVQSPDDLTDVINQVQQART
ncbi:glycosyltransferase [uncultured Tateyamaria sp.]|uniref:glycosyltransferase n=1 Tax=Tateyamaria sp. 1078 TaxID=3417464 RepID=UPI002619E032|nr:glycosyltransferase [uncultured Tateyamaria sp.]